MVCASAFQRRSSWSAPLVLPSAHKSATISPNAHDLGAGIFGGYFRGGERIDHDLRKGGGIRSTLDHKLRQRVGSVKNQIATPEPWIAGIKPQSSHSPFQLVPVRFRGNDDRRIATAQG